MNPFFFLATTLPFLVFLMLVRLTTKVGFLVVIANIILFIDLFFAYLSTM